MTRLIFCISFHLLLVLRPYSQPWHYDFGTTSGSYSLSNSASTTFLPTAPSGTSRVKVSNGQGGSFNLENQIITFGDGVYLRIIAPTGGSVNKFSVYDYSPGNCFSIRFKMRLGSSSGSSTGATSGIWHFFAGDGTSFSDNAGFSTANTFVGIQMTFGSSGSVTTNYRSGTSWVNTGLAGTPFVQGVDYIVEIYGNNSSLSQDYTYHEISQSVAPNKWDLWVNGVITGNDLSKGGLADNGNIDSWMFYALSSADNSANIFLDDIDYTNVIAPAPMPVKLSSFIVTNAGRNSVLKWSTDWELNNAGFHIERIQQDLHNGNSSLWTNVGFVTGQGTTYEPKSYSFEDKNLSSGVYQYRLKQIDYNGNYEYFESEIEIIIGKPSEFSLSQNYPNPSNPKCKIGYQNPIDGNVTLKVYDVSGEEVTTLVNSFKKADYYTVEFDGSNLASGIYFYRIAVIGENQIFTKTLKMVLVK